MKIIRATCWPIEIAMEAPYTIFYETIERCVNVILRIESDSGIVAWGCAAPDLPVTGETADTVINDFHQYIEPILLQHNPLNYIRILEILQNLLPNSPSAVAMADIALFDLVARHARMPLYQLLGGYRESIPTSITIGIMSLTDTLQKARQFIDQGFFILKIKGGINIEEDIEKMIALRKAFGKNIALRFDGNQGYNADEAIHFIHETAAVGIELLEQPTTKDDMQQLHRVTNASKLPVMADESLTSLSDVFRLTRHDAIDMVNIKLMKVGGIAHSLHINSVARAAGVEAMIGCMDECELGIAAGLHLALSRRNIHYADLDGHLDLVGDPFKGLIRLEKGILYPGQGHGLGNLSLSLPFQQS
jgi:L-Ala-D/L-Glu epimerase